MQYIGTLSYNHIAYIGGIMSNINELTIKCDVDSVFNSATEALECARREDDKRVLKDIIAVTRHAKAQAYLYCHVPLSQYKLIYGCDFYE